MSQTLVCNDGREILLDDEDYERAKHYRWMSAKGGAYTEIDGRTISLTHFILGIDEKDYYIKMTSGYAEDGEYITAWSYKHKYDKETDELISKDREAFSRYFK